MSVVSLTNIVKRFGAFTAVHPMSLEIPEGSFITLLGPSGCGKTTTLRMIAGLLDPTEGDITIGGERVNDLPIHKRNLGIVFQNYALFPHKTIAQNVAFGLKYRDVSKEEIKKRVNLSNCPMSETDTPLSCPAVSSSGSPSPARSSLSPMSSCWTNRSPRSTQTCVRICGSNLSAFNDRPGSPRYS